MPDQGLRGDEAAGAADPTDSAGVPVPSWLPLGASLVLLALAAGVIQRGGYFSSTRVVVLVLAGAGLVAALVGSTRPARSVRWALLVGWVLVVGSAAISAVVAGDLDGAWEVAGLALLFVAGVAATSATPVVSRPVVADALLLVAVVVAASAWVGVLWRRLPWGYSIDDLWRGGSTLTYANAAAALLAMVFVLSVARLAADRSAGAPVRLGTLAAGVGLVITLNRGGLIAAAIGLGVVLLGFRGLRVWPVAVRQGLGVAVAAVGVLPSLPDERAANLVLAMVALLAGAAIVLGVDRRVPAAAGRAVVLVGLLTVVVVAALGASSWRQDLDELADARLALGSDDRVGVWGAAVDEWQGSPWVGGGPASTTFQWNEDDGSLWRIQYVHNEYLELLATQGLLGVVAVLVAALLLLRTARGVVLDEVPWLRAGVAGAVVAFLVHCSLDFTFHIPVLALAFGSVSGLALPSWANVPTSSTGGGSDVGGGL